MLELLILYDCRKKICWLDQKTNLDRSIKGSIPENCIIAGSVRINSTADYQKAEKIASRVKQKYDSLYELNFCW